MRVCEWLELYLSVRRGVRSLGDNWGAILKHRHDVIEVVGVDLVKEACEKSGKAYADLDLALFLAPQSPKELEEQLSFGYNHVIFGLPSEGRETVLPVLDKIVELKERVLI